MMKIASALSFLACATLLLRASAPASITPTADAFIAASTSQNQAGTEMISKTNYGGAGALAVAAPNSPKKEFDSVIKFNLGSTVSSFGSDFPNGWTVQNITLTLSATPPNNNLFNGSGGSPANTAGLFNVRWIQNDSYVEGTGQPNSNPTTTDIDQSHLNFNNRTNYLTSGTDESLGTFSFSGGTSGAASYTLSLTPGFLSDVTAGGDVSLYLTPADSSIAYLFNSRSGPGGLTTAPQLTITAVPEAGTAIFGSAMLLGAVLRRRRKVRAA